MRHSMLMIDAHIMSQILVVHCQLEELRHCLPLSVREILNELPESLDETYERVLRGTNTSNRDDAHHLLQCLTVAVRSLPLTLTRRGTEGSRRLSRIGGGQINIRPYFPYATVWLPSLIKAVLKRCNFLTFRSRSS